MRKMLKCDFEGCNEFAYWFREFHGTLLSLCSKHEAMCNRKRWGKHRKESDLDEDDLRYLAEKEMSIEDLMRE